MDNPSPKFLVFVEADANHNKFYRMIPQGSTFKVEYGRVGCNKIREDEYDIAEFWKKYNSKIKKGYQDQTELVKDLIVEKKDGGQGFASIAQASISEIVERLQKYAKKCVAENYTVKAEQVTKAMVDKAQQILNELSDPAEIDRRSVQWFNGRLEELFRTIPRKMAHVKDFLAESSGDYNKIISREQDTLDTMAGQVNTNAAAASDANDEGQQKTVLDKLGLKIEDATDEEIQHIKNHLGRDIAAKFKKAWRVTNVKTQAKYDAFIKANNITNKKMYYHGSRNENWWNIIQTGLILRPTGVVITGKMFGHGIYFANKARKSYGYCSAQGSYWARGNAKSGFLAVYDVAEGQPYTTQHHRSEFYDYNWKKFSAAHPGCDSLFAKGGADLVNDEIIVYREEQCTIHYLIEVS